MHPKTRVFGHQIHPMLVVFPMGLLLSMVLFDTVGYFTGRVSFSLVAYWNCVLGLATGLLAASFGFVDWLAIPNDTRAKDVGAWHAGVTFCMLMLFGWSCLLRIHTPDHSATILSFALSCVAVATAGVGGWLGGELVNRYGVGVAEGANLDGVHPQKQAPPGEKD